MRSIALFVTLCLGSLTVGTGCATVAANLPAVLAAINDGTLVLETIADFVKNYFALNPNKDLEAKIDAAITKARMALDTALRIANGAQNIDQAKIDEAFSDFKAAYADLIALIGPLGMKVQGTMLTASSTGGLIVPEPLALTLKLNSGGK